MLIPFHKAYTNNDEIEQVTDAIKSGWLTMGPKTIEFEKRFGQYIGMPYSLSLNSATAALHLALKAIGLKADEEVILPTNTFIATAEVVTYFQAKPVLCDIEENAHNINVSLIKKLITPKTKAIIPVHFGGTPCEMDSILEIARKYNLKVIEDAAHALPAFYKDKKIGTISDLTCFSFYATKTLATGEGGMAVTANEEYANNIKINRLHGMSKDAWNRYSLEGSWYYEIVDNGYKYNMTDLNAGLGLAQLKKLEWLWQERIKIAQKYLKAFMEAKIEFLKIPEGIKSSWHLFVIKVSNRNEFIELMKKDGINCSVHFIPVHKHPYYKKTYGYQDIDYPTANKVYEKSVSLPIWPGMTDEEIEYVIAKTILYAR